MADRKPSHRAAERKVAQDRGEPHYFTGRPCKRGHIAERLTESGYCLECRRERDRIKYLKNPEYFALKRKDYYDKNSELMRKKSREWSSAPENKEKMKATRAAYMQKCGHVVLEKGRRSAKSYRERFPDKVKQAIDNWWNKNPERKKTYHRNRRANKRGNGGSHTQAEINEIFKAQDGKCAYCRKRLGKATNERHVDHIVPLINGGKNDRRNLQILCQPCNLEKGRRDPIDHARKIGLLI